jgi:hypothetical protein
MLYELEHLLTIIPKSGLNVCFWVISGHRVTSASCPLYPRKRTSQNNAVPLKLRAPIATPTLSSLLALSCPDVLNLPGAIQGLDIEMDRADAIRLLQTLAAAGMDTRAPRANVWIEKKGLEIGLEGRPICQRRRICRK